MRNLQSILAHILINAHRAYSVHALAFLLCGGELFLPVNTLVFNMGHIVYLRVGFEQVL